LVQHLQGHASITMTLDCYSHWMPSMDRNTAKRMDEASLRDQGLDRPSPRDTSCDVGSLELAP
jgi:hypothetical protein